MTTALPWRPAPIVLAAPSGTGKTTIAHALVMRYDEYVFSISVTTRSPRGGERDGKDYRFVTDREFRRMVEEGALVEWAEVHGNLYGTPAVGIEAAREAGTFPVLDIDVQGARQIRDRIPDAILIFIFPPSGAALVGRLTARGTEAEESVRMRLEAAHRELEEAAEFDYVVVNDELDEAVDRIREIVESDGHRPGRARDLPEEVARVRAEIDRLLAGGRAGDRASQVNQRIKRGEPTT